MSHHQLRRQPADYFGYRRNVDEPQLSWRFSVSGPWGLVHILGDETFIWRCDFITVPVADVIPFSWVNELRQDMQRYAVTGGDGVAKKWRDSFAWQRLPKFSAAVLQHVITIETLRPMTYGQVAAAIGRPRSARRWSSLGTEPLASSHPVSSRCCAKWSWRVLRKQ